MVDSLREFYTHWESVLFAGAVLVCVLFSFLVAREEWRGRRPPKGYAPMFPDHVHYYGAIYRRCDSLPSNFIPKYLAGYSVGVIVMGALETLIEGELGLFLKLEVWGIAGGFLGLSVFSYVGAWVGVLCTGIIMHIKKHRVSVARTALTWVSLCSRLGEMFGWLGGMAFFYIIIALLHELEWWYVTLAAIIPALLLFGEYFIKTSSWRKGYDFEAKCMKAGIPFIGGPHSTYTREGCSYPDRVVSFDDVTETGLPSVRERGTIITPETDKNISKTRGNDGD